MPTLLPDGESRLGMTDAPADVRSLIGYCLFDSPDAALLVSLLPGSCTSAANGGWRRSCGSWAKKHARSCLRAPSS